MKRSYFVWIIGAGMIIAGFSSPWLFTDFLLQNETKNAEENIGVVVIEPAKQFSTNITLHGEKNVTADFLLKQTIPIQISITSIDGTTVWNATIENSKDFKFYNTKPAGIYQLKALNLANKSTNFTYNIIDNSCWGQNDFIKCVSHKYPLLIELLGLIIIIGYGGIGVVGVGGLLFFLDRRKTHT